MKEFEFANFRTVSGVGGSSGMLTDGSEIILISDDSFAIYYYSISDSKLRKSILSGSADPAENITKKLKPDFESVSEYGNSYHLFGSGSDTNRFERVEISTGPNAVISRKSLKPLYTEMMRISEIGTDDFNIEGVIIGSDRSFFFNRGNGPNRKNGIFSVNGWDTDHPKISYRPFELPCISDSVFGFTDACLSDGIIFFSASAESGGSTYHDGKVLGSAVGIISEDELKLIDFFIVTYRHKLEGITMLSSDPNHIEFLLCEDPDNDSNQTRIFKLKIKKPVFR